MTPLRVRTPRPMGGELVIPVLAVAFTLYYFSTIWSAPWTAQVGAFLIGGVLLGLCAMFFVKAALHLRAGRASLEAGSLVGFEDVRSGRLGLIAATIGYAWLIDAFGFTLTTFLFLFVSFAILNRGRRLGLGAAVAALMALGGWALFIWAFETRFPRGWFETAMRSLLDG